MMTKKLLLVVLCLPIACIAQTSPGAAAIDAQVNSSLGTET
jgi:hypothetical protein